MISAAFFAAFLAMAAGAGQKSTCVQSGHCACTFDDGFAMDLSKMAGLLDDNKPMYKDYIPTQGDKNFVYSYKPCYKFDYAASSYYCLGVASCQIDTSFSGEQNAGTQENAEFWEEDGKIMIKYADFATSPARETYVNLVCADSNSLEVQGEMTGSNPSRYDYTLYTPQACRSSGGSGLSVGTVLCILLVVLIVVYIVVGILFMKFRVGASGFELVPNLAFWKDFPLLIKDGACFSASPCRKSGEYSKL